MLLYISDPEARLIQMAFNFSTVSVESDITSFNPKPPRKQSNQLVGKVYPINFKNKMQRILDMNKSPRKDDIKFIPKLLTEAVHCRSYSTLKPYYKRQPQQNQSSTFNHK